MGLRTVVLESKTRISSATFAVGIAMSLTAGQDPDGLGWEAVNHCWGRTSPSLLVEKTTRGCRWPSDRDSWQRPKERQCRNYSDREKAVKSIPTSSPGFASFIFHLSLSWGQFAQVPHSFKWLTSIKQVVAPAIPAARMYHAQCPQKPLSPAPRCRQCPVVAGLANRAVGIS